MSFMSPNLDRRGRLVRFGAGLVFFVLLFVFWLAIPLFWGALIAAISTFICWFQAFRGWCFFQACRLKSGARSSIDPKPPVS